MNTNTPEDETQRNSEPIASPVASSLPRVPGYEIVELIGRGGMGRVFKARHLGLGRIVALKMLLGGSDDSLLARFQTEAQAVAALQHPHIAQVFESGWVDGQPFYSLEYVDGGSLARKLAGKPQPPREAAALVEILGRAVQHSHAHSILHRDLKPANILLTSDGTPKIADFGLAKHLQEGSKLTQTGDILGTPSYMAPEQASGVVTTLGPAVDIYALGAILYEMLTGRPPFQGPDVMQTLKMVVSMDPVPPRALQPRLPRDLETICLKSLEKSPRRRYASAADLADDLRRFLDGVPIRARPVRPWERMLKWAVRRPAAALLLLVSALAVVGLAVGFLQLRAANENLRTANRESEETLQVARLAIDRMLVRLSNQLAPVPQAEQVRRESLEDARALYEKLTAIRPRDPAGQSYVAQSLLQLGKIYQDLGRLDDAEASYQKARGALQELGRLHPDEPEYTRLGAAALNNLANVEQRRGRLDAAQRLSRSALQEMEPLLRAHSQDPAVIRAAAACHNTLALLLRAGQKLTDAEVEHRKALALRTRLVETNAKDLEARADQAVSHSNLAALLIVRKRAEDAASELAAAEKLLQGDAGPQRRYFLGQIQGNLAVAFEEVGKTAEAEKTHAAALATLQELMAEFPSVPTYRHVLARAHVNMARLLGPLGRSEQALGHLRTARPILVKLTKDFPDNAPYKTDLNVCVQSTIAAEQDLEEAQKNKPKGRK